MLYISRVTGMNEWGVVDTDDCTEQIATFEKLRTAMRSGVHIEGVSVEKTRFGKVFIKDVVKVRPHGVDTRQTAKLRMLRGIDICVRDCKLLYMSWDENAIHGEVRIRLSDYANLCSGFVFVYLPPIEHGSRVILELDDNIKVAPKTFTRIFMHRDVYVDVSRCTRDTDVKYVYMSWLDDTTLMGSISGVIDSPERHEIYEAAYYVLNHRTKSKTFSDECQAGVAKLFEREFATLSRANLDFDFEKNISEIKRYWKYQVQQDIAFWLGDRHDYEFVRCKSPETLDFIRACGNVNYYKITHFINFMCLVEPNKSIKASYVRLIVSANRSLISKAKAHGWLGGS